MVKEDSKFRIMTTSLFLSHQRKNSFIRSLGMSGNLSQLQRREANIGTEQESSI